MTREELKQAIKNTKQEICRVKEQLSLVTNPREEKKLLAKLKELQVRQIWYMDQFGVW